MITDLWGVALPSRAECIISMHSFLKRDVAASSSLMLLVTFLMDTTSGKEETLRDVEAVEEVAAVSFVIEGR